MKIESPKVAFSFGFLTATMLLTALMFSGIMPSNATSQPELTDQEILNKTTETINRRVLHNTPNNVTGEGVAVEEAGYGLEDFYAVSLEVKNPKASDVTTVYVKKDGSVFFLNNPRYFDPELYESQKHN